MNKCPTPCPGRPETKLPFTEALVSAIATIVVYAAINVFLDSKFVKSYQQTDDS
tara:strand:- start:236 stop:397 length:162 start_codon:yes stop_codon:yes gene_type:complete